MSVRANIQTLAGWPELYSYVKSQLSDPDGGLTAFNTEEFAVFPGFCDVHVHLREPGFSYKETVATGSYAGAHGGYTDLCAMPNLDPVPDSLTNLAYEQEIIRRDSVVHVHPYGAVTVGQQGETLAELESLAPAVVAFSDDGHGIAREEIMRRAMEVVAGTGKILADHCEDLSLTNGGVIQEGVFARGHGLRGISKESEWKAVARDLQLARETGCRFHVCHVSCKESVEQIRAAKAEGVDVTCETAPHYLLLDTEDLQDDGAFKMNPPLRTKEDRRALLEGLKDGTIDMIATDHAPHSAEEKSKGLRDSAFGITGLETAFSVLYTRLVEEKILTLPQLIDRMAIRPRERFGLSLGKSFTIWNLRAERTIDPESFFSLGHCTPFAGWKVHGRCCLTVCDGRIMYRHA